MVKKHAGKVIQMINPENYIRQKARSLPIYECLVNTNWKEHGMATIVIARTHSNGNITACFYLVDLFCLGVKDTHYEFNISKEEYHDLVDKAAIIDQTRIGYPLAHNIIYAAIDFAELYGFKPDKDFISITRFMLDEDTDEIELVEIECGRDGKPFYISGADDSQQKINSIIKQLEKTAGIGNFDYISEEEAFKYLKEEDDDLRMQEFKGMTFENKKQLFLNLEATEEDLNPTDSERLINVTNLIFDEIVDEDLFDEYYDEIWDSFQIDINDVVSDEMLGIKPGSVIIDNKTREHLMDIFNYLDNNYPKSRIILEKIKKQIPEIPILHFFDLLILQKENNSKYNENLKKLVLEFPDYPLIKLLFVIEKATSGEMRFKNTEYTCLLQTIFPGRTQLHKIEVLHFTVANILILSQLNDSTRLHAFLCVLEDLEFLDDNAEIIDDFIFFAKTRIVYNHLTS